LGEKRITKMNGEQGERILGRAGKWLARGVLAQGEGYFKIGDKLYWRQLN
jgi:hypothetical protein